MGVCKKLNGNVLYSKSDFLVTCVYNFMHSTFVKSWSFCVAEEEEEDST